MGNGFSKHLFWYSVFNINSIFCNKLFSFGFQRGQSPIQRFPQQMRGRGGNQMSPRHRLPHTTLQLPEYIGVQRGAPGTWNQPASNHAMMAGGSMAQVIYNIGLYYVFRQGWTSSS